MRYQKNIARLVLPFFLFFSVIQPARAVVPLVPVAVSVVNAAGTATTIDAGATAIATLIGAAVIYLAATDAAGNKVRVPLTAATPVPAPSAAASASQTKLFTSMGYSPYATTAVQACLDRMIPEHAGQGTVTCACWAESSIPAMNIQNPTATCSVYLNGVPHQNDYVGYVISCPSGYTVSGSSCVLSDARAVTSDKASDYARSGTTLSAASASDVDTAANPVHGALGAGGASYQFAGTDNNNKPISIVVTPQASGGSALEISKQGVDLAGNTMTTKVSLAVDAQGVVTSAYQAQTASSLNVDPVTQTATSSATGNTASNPTTETSIQLPTDYARTGEAAAAANTITQALNQPPATNPNLEQQKTELQNNRDSHKNLIDGLGNKGLGNEGGLLSWSMPQPVLQDNTCTDPSFEIMQGTAAARTVNVTGYCNAALKVRSILEWVLYVLTLFALFSIVTGSRGEE